MIISYLSQSLGGLLSEIMGCLGPHTLWTTKTCPKIVVHFKNHNFQDTASVSVTLFLNYNEIIIKLEYASTIALSEPVFERG